MTLKRTNSDIITRHPLLAIALPGVRDVIVSRLLRATQIEQQIAVRRAADIVVGNDWALGVAIDTKYDLWKVSMC